ncbi:MAG: hypothetical protein AB8H03_27690 [Saprospiraceae bacterium]
MKILNIIFGILFLGTIYYAVYLGNLQTVLAEKTNPEFNYLTFEMAPDRDFSKALFASIHENGMVGTAQETLDEDVWFILFYVSSTVLGWIILLKNFKVTKNWLFILIAVLGIVAGVCDTIENGHLTSLLANWESAASAGSVEKASFFAKIKFAIITPLALGGLLGWIYFFGKKGIKFPQKNK